jgi:hypothetical protein
MFKLSRFLKGNSEKDKTDGKTGHEKHGGIRENCARNSLTFFRGKAS